MVAVLRFENYTLRKDRTAVQRSWRRERKMRKMRAYRKGEAENVQNFARLEGMSVLEVKKSFCCRNMHGQRHREGGREKERDRATEMEIEKREKSPRV